MYGNSINNNPINYNDNGTLVVEKPAPSNVVSDWQIKNGLSQNQPSYRFAEGFNVYLDGNFVQNKYGTDFLFLSLPTTSPLRKNNDVLKCINFVEKKNYDCSLTVTKTNSDPYFNMVIKKNKNFYPIFNNKNSRSKNSFYTITTVAYCAKISFIKKTKHILDGNIKFLEVDFRSSLDIDEISDLKIAELLLKK